MLELSVYIGWDPRETEAFAVCEYSIKKRSSIPLKIYPVVLSELKEQGLYTRSTEIREGTLWDTISGAPMSTEFAITRFAVPILSSLKSDGAKWALFCDCDFLWLNDVAELLEQVDQSKALWCVQHHYEPTSSMKMDNQVQLSYARKNWSSMMLFNLEHPAHKKLDAALLNSVPGRDLHRFCWLQDDEIGSVDVRWNWLEGTSPVTDVPPAVVHYTRGGPWMKGWEDVDYASLWLKEFEVLQANKGQNYSCRL
jgi:hypothetical protein